MGSEMCIRDRHNNSGYLFCSNYLYRNSKKDYKNVQFKVKLKDETLRIPNHKITVKDGTYLVQRPFVLVTKEGAALSETAQKFFDFATSADAASIISAAGAVPVA